MANNGNNLHAAKINKNDEFYTQFEDIDKEITNYFSQLQGKIIYCNCDNPASSNFFKFFLANFKIFDIKKLICTCYDRDSSPLSQLFLTVNEPHSKAIEVVVTDVCDYDNDGCINITDAIKMINDVIVSGNNTNYISVKTLNPDGHYGAGDFRSSECIELLKEADVVCTNPPFSLFREFVDLMEKYNKQYLIIGSQNAITYKEIFSLIKNNKLWLGYNHPKEFMQPDGTLKKFGNILWYTNLDTRKRHHDIPFHPFKFYNSLDYPTYDNYNAIEVGEMKNYPCDYFGVAGVPISFLDKYNPDQFEILGLGRDYPMSEQFVSDYYRSGGTGSYRAGNPLLGYYDKDGKAIIPFMRILVKRLR